MPELSERSVRSWSGARRAWRAARPHLPSVLPLVAAHLAFLLLFDLAARPVAALGVFALAMAALLWAWRRLAAAPGSKAVLILAVACLLRLLLLPLPPTLSDDVLRYVWDGRVAAAGFDPYRLAPAAAELETLRDDLWERLPHREVPTVYPPLAIALFSTASRLPAPIPMLKLALAGADVVACALLLGIARRLSLSEERVVLYAWNPLVTLEVAGMGHVDALGVAAAVAAVALLLRPSRSAAAGVAAAAATLSKLVPVLLTPVWARASRRPLGFLAAALLLPAAALLPLAAAGAAPPGLVTYGVSWEFNGPLYEPLWRLLERWETRAWIEEHLDRLKERDGRHEFWNRFYPFNYPQLQARLLLAPGILVGLALAWRRRHPVAASGIAFGAVLICSATVYPWYLLWILPWAALCRQPAWLLLSATLPLSYLPQTTDLALMPWVYVAIWAPFFAALAVRPRWSIA